MRTALVTVVSGEAYARYAEELFDSAREFFQPTEQVEFIRLDGREGWPDATMFRWHVCLENWMHLHRFDHLYLSDADMRFEGLVGANILAPLDGTVATVHPGYVGKPHWVLPYERREDSMCHVVSSEGDVYYAGGFAGGDRDGFRWLAERIKERIDADVSRGIVPAWHDESALNRVLALTPPDVTLSPSHCHPDKDLYYRESVWTEDYPRLLVALDKPEHERHGR